MDDDSDDGNLPGQSFFKRKNIEQDEQENNRNDNYDENYGNQDYQNNDNYDYENNDYNCDDGCNNDFIEEHNYNDDDNFNTYDKSQYDYEYENENEKKCYNYYKHSNKNNNRNNRDNINNRHKKYNNNYYQKYNLTKTKESYLTSFGINFKLWLMLVIKKVFSEKKIIEFTDNENINKEVTDSFLTSYDLESNTKQTNEKNNLNISIKDFELKEIVGKNYNVDFSIIIIDKIEIFFVNKFIEMKVKGEFELGKYPKFYFSIKQYKLTLDSNKIKNNENKTNIIENIDLDENKTFIIGMCPDYSINDKSFKKLLMKINGEENKKDPQKEIMDCLDNLIYYKHYK